MPACDVFAEVSQGELLKNNSSFKNPILKYLGQSVHQLA